MARPKIGLALSSGGAKGFAHVGVLKALAEAGIRVDVIAGSSIGSLVGAFYATGMSPYFMEGLATSLSWRHWTDFTVPKMGMIAGDRILQMVSMLTRGRSIEDTHIPLAIVATEILTRRQVVFRNGSIAKAVRASISIPGVFVPYVMEQCVYVDGGVVNPVPIDVARDLGADFVIAVHVGAHKLAHAPESMVDVLMQSIDVMQDIAYRHLYDSADFVILPEVAAVGITQFKKAQFALDAGYAAARSALPAIHDALAKYSA